MKKFVRDTNERIRNDPNQKPVREKDYLDQLDENPGESSSSSSSSDSESNRSFIASESVDSDSNKDPVPDPDIFTFVNLNRSQEIAFRKLLNRCVQTTSDFIWHNHQRAVRFLADWREYPLYNDVGYQSLHSWVSTTIAAIPTIVEAENPTLYWPSDIDGIGFTPVS